MVNSLYAHEIVSAVLILWVAMQRGKPHSSWRINNSSRKYIFSYLQDILNPYMMITRQSSHIASMVHALGLRSVDEIAICYWRCHQAIFLPEKCHECTWKVISNFSDIASIHGHIHGQSFTNAIWLNMILTKNVHFETHKTNTASIIVFNTSRPSDANMRQWTMHHRFIWWLFAWSVPNHNRNQNKIIVKWTLWKTISDNFGSFTFKSLLLCVSHYIAALIC